MEGWWGEGLESHPGWAGRKTSSPSHHTSLTLLPFPPFLPSSSPLSLIFPLPFRPAPSLPLPPPLSHLLEGLLTEAANTLPLDPGTLATRIPTPPPSSSNERHADTTTESLMVMEPAAPIWRARREGRKEREGL